MSRRVSRRGHRKPPGYKPYPPLRSRTYAQQYDFVAKLRNERFFHEFFGLGIDNPFLQQSADDPPRAAIPKGRKTDPRCPLASTTHSPTTARPAYREEYLSRRSNSHRSSFMTGGIGAFSIQTEPARQARRNRVHMGGKCFSRSRAPGGSGRRL